MHLRYLKHLTIILFNNRSLDFYMCGHSPEISPTIDPPSPYYFTLVRHGETEANSRNAFIGITDSPLNNIGRTQARSTAQYLATQGWKFDLILSSPLQRCTETAQIISDTLDLPFRINGNLIERNYGIFENRTQEEITQTHPQLLASYLIEKPFVMIPEGESAIELERRIHELLWFQIPAQHPQVRHILFITHLNPVRAFLRLFGVKSWEVYFEKFSNASVTRLRTDFQKTEVMILDFSCHEDPECNANGTTDDTTPLN
ncbi:MAG: histidine phosphatase family protein [Promethearchaeota archaeon]